MNQNSLQYDQASGLMDSESYNWQPIDENGFTSPWAPKAEKVHTIYNYLIATILTMVVSVGFAVSFPICLHWSLIILSFCGIIVTADLVAWIRGEVDVFDLKVPVAGILYLNTYLAPLLHLCYNLYGEGIYTRDWPLFFGYMGCFNLGGICALKFGQMIFFKLTKFPKKVWLIDSRKLSTILWPVLTVSLLATLIVRVFFGGLVKESGSYTISAGAAQFYGQLSWLLMLGDPAPTIILLSIIHFVSQHLQYGQPKNFTIWCSLIFMAVLQFFWVGLRGSRSAIMWGLVIVVAMIHFRWKPFKIKTLLFGLILIVIFLHLYDYRKKFGQRGWAAFYSSAVREELKHAGGTERTILATVLGDLAKADVQAFLLYGLMENVPDYKYIYGKTYIMSALVFIPRGIWPSKPLSPKLEAGTKLQGYSSTASSSRVYGLAGEAMLNFGYYGIIPAFFIYGCALGWMRKKIVTMVPYDSRFFLVPLLLLICLLSVDGDTDNWTFGMLKMGILPFIIIYFSSIRIKLEQ